MILTSLTLGTAVVLVAGAKLAQSRNNNPRIPFLIGLGLAFLAPTLLISFVMEWILLCAWNPLIWME